MVLGATRGGPAWFSPQVSRDLGPFPPPPGADEVWEGDMAKVTEHHGVGAQTWSYMQEEARACVGIVRHVPEPLLLLMPWC